MYLSYQMTGLKQAVFITFQSQKSPFQSQNRAERVYNAVMNQTFDGVASAISLMSSRYVELSAAANLAAQSVDKFIQSFPKEFMMYDAKKYRHKKRYDRMIKRHYAR
jgi:hypothetical protein